MPSLARRLVILFGLVAGGCGAYLAYWGGYDAWRPAAELLMFAPLPALAAGRRLDRTH